MLLQFANKLGLDFHYRHELFDHIGPRPLVDWAWSDERTDLWLWFFGRELIISQRPHRAPAPL